MGREDLIRQRAHAIWESEGRPDDRSEEHWKMASAEIERAEAAPTEAGAQSPPTTADAKPAKAAKNSGAASGRKPAATKSKPSTTSPPKPAAKRGRKS